MTILVVEDEELLLNFVDTSLKEHGCDVLTASSPAEALQIAKSHAGNIDLLMTDMCLPHMEGSRLAKEFKKTNEQAGIIYMTASPRWELEEHFSGETVLPKPFSLDALYKTVSKSLGVGTP